jgi:hypothetical protein
MPVEINKRKLGTGDNLSRNYQRGFGIVFFEAQVLGDGGLQKTRPISKQKENKFVHILNQLDIFKKDECTT